MRDFLMMFFAAAALPCFWNFEDSFTGRALVFIGALLLSVALALALWPT